MYSFPKIFQLGTQQVNDIFNDEIEITEKIDGSQFRFGLDRDGKLQCFSRGAQLYFDHSHGLFEPATAFALSVQHLLQPDHMYYGETLCKEKHNVLTYGKVPTNNFCLFGVSTLKNTKFYPWDKLKIIAETLGCDIVPLLYKGKINPEGNLVEIVEEYLKLPSYLGNCLIEGIVIKNLNRAAYIGGIIMPITCAKYVSESFKEIHKKDNNWVPNKDKILLIYEQYLTKARWNKSIQHMKEAGEIEGSPKDIGKLLNEIQSDIVNDHKQEIMEQLWNATFSNHKGIWIKGFPEYYKKFLLENQS